MAFWSGWWNTRTNNDETDGVISLDLDNMATDQQLTVDNPIQTSSEDVLSRDPLAKSFVQQILKFDSREGLVVGVLGAWGHGKTSFINLVRKHLVGLDITILEFNPWMFSGTEQLVDSFFNELASQLKLKPSLEEVGKAVEEYGEVFSGLGWLPVVGVWLERGKHGKDLLGKLMQSRKQGVGGRRKKVSEALSKLDTPIVVVLDDIDRLTTSEIRDVFRLIRLTANFPNIIYLVSLDRKRVESALQEENIPGRDYLEKILQFTLDLPPIPPQILQNQILSSIDQAISDIPQERFDSSRWPDVFVEIIRPLIRSMRDVRRYAAAVSAAVSQADDRVQVVDVLALEAVRVFMPEIFQELPSSILGLTKTSSSYYGSVAEPEEPKKQIERLLELSGDRKKVVMALISRLFPAGIKHFANMSYGSDHLPTWLKERRVAHEDILRLYLERQIGDSLGVYYKAELAFGKISDENQFESFLSSLDPKEALEIISELEAFEGQFVADHVVPGIVTILNIWPKLPEQDNGFLTFGTRLTIGRVTYRLLRSLGDPLAIEAAVTAILPRLHTLSARHEVITDIGYMEGAGHKLVSEEAAAQFEKQWREQVRNASVSQFVNEPELLRILIVAQKRAEAEEPILMLPEDTRFTLALLRSASGRTFRQTMGDRHVERTTTLAWETLKQIVGDEACIKDRLDRLIAEDSQAKDEEVVKLALRYLDGERPENLD